MTWPSGAPLGQVGKVTLAPGHPHAHCSLPHNRIPHLQHLPSPGSLEGQRKVIAQLLCRRWESELMWPQRIEQCADS